jgi:hypothetical protein
MIKVSIIYSLIHLDELLNQDPSCCFKIHEYDSKRSVLIEIEGSKKGDNEFRIQRITVKCPSERGSMIKY